MVFFNKTVVLNAGFIGVEYFLWSFFSLMRVINSRLLRMIMLFLFFFWLKLHSLFVFHQ